MPVQFDLPKLLGATDITEVIRNKLNDQANINRIKALTSGQNLSNQAEQLKMPYVVPREKSFLENLNSEIAKRNLEAKYIPTKYNQAGQRLGIESGNLDINKRRYAQDQLDTLKRWRESQIASKGSVGQSVDSNGMPINQPSPMPSSPIQNSGNSQMPLALNQGQQNVFPQLQQGIPSQQIQGAPQQEKFEGDQNAPDQFDPVPGNSGRLYNKKRDQYLVRYTKPEQTQVAKQVVALQTAVKKLPELIDIASQGLMGAPTSSANRYLDPNLAARYHSLQSAMTEILSPTFPNLPKVKQMMAKVDALSSRYPLETSEGYKSRMHDTLNDFQNQLSDVLEDYGRGGRIVPGQKTLQKQRKSLQSSANGLQNQQSFPTFNTRDEFLAWKAKASPEEIQAYKKHLHG